MCDERKQAIRQQARSKRHERREHELAARGLETGAGKGAFSPAETLPCEIHPEGPALMEAWRGLLHSLHLTYADLLPALFLPTPTEPDIRLLFGTVSHCLVPALVGKDGCRLPDPAWVMWDAPSVEALPRPLEILGAPMRPEVLRQADIVLLPALAVDEDGTRIGQGGGWYDRALKHARPGAPIVAVIFDDEWSAQPLPRLSHDVCVDAVVTPGGFRILTSDLSSV